MEKNKMDNHIHDKYEFQIANITQRLIKMGSQLEQFALFLKSMKQQLDELKGEK